MEGAYRNGEIKKSPSLISSLPDGGLKLLWKFDLPEPASKKPYYSSPVSSNGRVYFKLNPPQQDEKLESKKRNSCRKLVNMC